MGKVDFTDAAWRMPLIAVVVVSQGETNAHQTRKETDRSA